VSGLKDEIARDIDSVFMDLDEFAELHVIEGSEIPVVIAPDEQIELAGGAALGLGENSITLYARTQDLPKRKRSGSVLSLDGKECTIVKWSEHMGMSVIVLDHVEGY
jgi:hypothetical protein